ncbi:chromate resistance protein ChrB domain-containing protein [Rhodoferax sp.]|uniref:chromate resistance protein ChrB domain-containing protein n=1 Tax=Rhodoferax sp. TaxID=50421 RepID=UPI0025F566FE|nr:chromate resistance protein ChrB domain-containing protein [Rhodoferax sp.]
MWITLVTSLPTENATARMRAWRALKASGAAVLKDGVYVMPERPACRAVLESVAADVLAGGGSAYVMTVQEPANTVFTTLFDCSADFAALLAELPPIQALLASGDRAEATRLCRKARKAFGQIVETDFFPGEAQRQVEAALQTLEAAMARAAAPDEPKAATGTITQLQRAHYQGRTWATRARPWVDRLASAWLIQRHIDPQARILWLASPQDCPADALGFDFDGATFSHVEGRVTFEVLLASFALEGPALQRLGALVHFLDAGGVQPPEASGVEAVLAGLRASIADDDLLLQAARSVFDALLQQFDPTP